MIIESIIIRNLFELEEFLAICRRRGAKDNAMIDLDGESDCSVSLCESRAGKIIMIKPVNSIVRYPISMENK